VPELLAVARWVLLVVVVFRAWPPTHACMKGMWRAKWVVP